MNGVEVGSSDGITTLVVVEVLGCSMDGKGVGIALSTPVDVGTAVNEVTAL
jgi:hypothetical protein